MKSLFAIFILILSNNCFSQSDTIALNTPAVFSITFKENHKALIFDRNYTSYKEVYLDVLTKDYLIIRKKFDDVKNPKAISRYVQVSLKDIEALGYATGTEETFGGVLGLGIGAVGGTIVSLLGKSADNTSQGFNPGSTKSITGQVIGWTLTGAILGYIIGGHSNEYKSYDLSKYNDEKKYEEINIIVKKGLSLSKKK